MQSTANYPFQSGARLIDGSDLNGLFNGSVTASGFATSSVADDSATPATSRSIHGQMTVNFQGTITSGNQVGVRGITTVAAGTTIGGGFIYGAQGKVTVVGSLTGGTTTAGMSQYDLSNATTISGGANSIHWFDLGQTADGTKVAAGTINGLRITNTTAATMASILGTIYGKANYLADFSANGSNWLSTTGTIGATAGKGWLKVSIEGKDRYIGVSDSVS